MENGKESKLSDIVYDFMKNLYLWIGKSKIIRSRCCWSIKCGKSLVGIEWFTKTVANKNRRSSQHNQVKKIIENQSEFSNGFAFNRLISYNPFVDAVVVACVILGSQPEDLIMQPDSVTYVKFDTLHEK